MKRTVAVALVVAAAAAGWYYARMRLRFPAVYLEGIEAPARVTIGEEFPLTIVLRADGAVGADHDLFIHFRRGEGEKVNADVILPLEMRKWESGRTARLGPFRCAIPAGMAPGGYTIEAGLFTVGRDVLMRRRYVRIPYRNRGMKDWTVGAVEAARRPPRVFDAADFGARGYAVGTAGPLDKVFPDRGDYVGSLARRVEVSAARGERESFQVVVIAGDEGLGGVRVTPGGLSRAAGGQPLPADRLAVRRVGYVETRRPFYNVTRTGPWPDPLFPQDEGGVSVPPGRAQPFWVDLSVPADAPPGAYEGTLTVEADGRPPAEVALSLTVWDFALPRVPTLKSGFDFYEFIIRRYYPRREGETEAAWRERVEEICRRYYLDMLDHRISPINNVGNPRLVEIRDGRYILDFEEFGRKVEFYTAAGQTDFGIAREARIDPDRGVWSDSWYGFTGPDAVRGVFREFGRYLEERGWLRRAYAYILDETYRGAASLTRLVHEGHPGIRNLLTQTPAEGFPDVDIWCVRINNLDEARLRAFRERGSEIWMYVASPTRPFPTIILDGPSLDVRVLPWICRRYRAEGLLYWCVNYWHLADPREDPMTWLDQNGNGSLYYPGPDGPIGSIRLAVLRDGMEDYEYLRLLGEAGLEADLERLLGTVAPSAWRHTDAPATLLAARDAAGALLGGRGR
ncbi:MAG: DUF6067 family protein [bacterium]|nr:DUF6067 family protein [bacterium]